MEKPIEIRKHTDTYRENEVDYEVVGYKCKKCGNFLNIVFNANYCGECSAGIDWDGALNYIYIDNPVK